MTDSDPTSTPAGPQAARDRPRVTGRADERARRRAFAKFESILAAAATDPTRAAAPVAISRASGVFSLRPLGLMTDEERASATEFADPAFDLRVSITMIDAIDALAQRLRSAAGVLALIEHRAEAEGDRLTAGAAASAGADIYEAAALCRVLSVGLCKHGGSDGAGA